jgi:integrase
LTGSAATRRRTLSAIKALLTTGFKMGALRFNVGAALRLPKVVSRRAERRLEEIELFRLLTAVEKKPRDRAIIEALYGTGAHVDELVQLKRQQLVADIDGAGGYVTLYGKHGGRTIRVGQRTWDALQFLADGKEPILTAAAAAAGLKKKLSPHWPRHAGSRVAEHDGPLPQFGADGRVEPIFAILRSPRSSESRAFDHLTGGEIGPIPPRVGYA